MTEIPQNLHRDIMRSVKVVKTRYYLYGVFTGFLISLLAVSYMVYNKMIEHGSADFFSVWLESVQIDIAELFDFNDELKEFFPWNDLLIWFLILAVVGILLTIIMRFRKVLFLKVEKFSKEKKTIK